MKKFFFLAVFALLGTLAWADNMPSQKVGDVAPECVAADTLGVEHSLKNFHGQYVVVDFWASWCGDCRREFPALKALHEEYADKTIKGKKVAWVSVSFDHDAGAWKRCLQKEQFPWLQVSNLVKWKENPIAQAWGLHWIPTLFIISPEGKVVGFDITVEGIKAALEKLQ